MLSFALAVGASSWAHADGQSSEAVELTTPLLAGAWAVEAGRASQRTTSGGHVVEIDDGRLRLDGQGHWLLAARRINLNYDVLGRLDSVGAHGQVRLVGRDNASRHVSYAMGELAWFDAAGVRGVVMGPGVAIVRDDWRIGAAHIEVDLRTSELTLRGVKSGETRFRRDDK
jgi:hypothetical protein